MRESGSEKGGNSLATNVSATVSRQGNSVMAGYIGEMYAFDSCTDDWNMYCEWIEQYFDAIHEEKYASVIECYRRKSLSFDEKFNCS